MVQGILFFAILHVFGTPGVAQDRDQLLRQAREDLRSKDVEVRLEALKELALLGIGEDGEPDRKVAEHLARGARDESIKVRTEAIRLLLAGQHRVVALDTLLESLDEIRKDQARIGRKSGTEDETDAAAMRLRRRHAFQVIDGLARLPDDRAVKALVDFMGALPRRQQDVLIVRASTALVELGARDGMEAVILRLGELEARAARGSAKKQARQLHELLRSNGKTLGLKDMPVAGPNTADDWRRWYSRNQKHYAARLGKITAKPADD